MEYAFRLASAKAAEGRKKQKRVYNVRVCGARIEPGDWMLVRNAAPKGKHKIEDSWLPDVYTVISQPNLDIPVIELQREDDTAGTVAYFQCP